MDKTYGNIELTPDYIFHWSISNPAAPEVYGSIEKVGTGYISNGSGWYRTADPEVAADYARTLINTGVIK